MGTLFGNKAAKRAHKCIFVSFSWTRVSTVHRGKTRKTNKGQSVRENVVSNRFSVKQSVSFMTILVSHCVRLWPWFVITESSHYGRVFWGMEVFLLTKQLVPEVVVYFKVKMQAQALLRFTVHATDIIRQGEVRPRSENLLIQQLFIFKTWRWV